MQQNKIFLLLLIFVLASFLAACARTQTLCSTEPGTVETTLKLSDLIETTYPVSAENLVSVEIGGKQVQVDKVVDYPLCNDHWSGTVYVSCQAQVAEAELDADANPLFLKGCDLQIEPNTVVYVAAHNDAAYYKGCSCHTGGAPQP